MILASTSDIITLITSTAGTINVQASWNDTTSGTTFVPGRTNTIITAATTTTIVASPNTNYQRQVRSLVITNADTAITQTITAQHSDGVNIIKVYSTILSAGTFAMYDGGHWIRYNASGRDQYAISPYVAGSDTQILFNNSGTTSTDTGFTWNTANQSLSLLGSSPKIIMKNITSEPTPPASGLLTLYSKSISGRIMPKYIGPSGVDSPLQPALFGNNVIMYYPTSANNGGTATLGGMGISWTAGGTVTHPTPSTGITNQIHRTQYSNVTATTNQVLGLAATAAGLPQFWRGNSTGQGGFFFMARVVLEQWPVDTLRLFIGLSDSATNQATLDISAMTGNFCAFARDVSDTSNVMYFITRNNVTTTKIGLSGMTIATGQGFDAYIFARPNDSNIYYRLDSINSGTTLTDSYTGVNVPINAAFMGPQVHMSNGTANITANTVSLSINRIYIESDH